MFSNHTRSIHPLIPAIAILVAAFAWQAGANAVRPTAQPSAIATVDIVEIIDQLKEREYREGELEINKNARQAQIDEVEAQLRVLEADLTDMKSGTNAYKEKGRQLLETRGLLKFRGEILNQMLSVDRGNVTREMYNKVTDAISRIAEREGYDIVLFDDSLFPITEDIPFADVYRSIVSRSVIYHHESADITNQVVTLMNAEFTTP
ncbi:MAG: OmpH family outer membrane protein [Phycisphaerales bacterium]|nr:OmpH family outer membrane protein [Phycisphaerales bacterium]